MEFTAQIANLFREVNLNGKWVALTNLKAELDDVTFEEATTKVGPLNTIALLAFHLNYYVAGVIQVFEGGPLDIRDKYSFDMPPLESKEDWEKMKNKTYKDAERYAELVEQIPDEKLPEAFVDEKYGQYFRNLIGMNEHCYYHLGQIVLLKKLIRSPRA